MSTEDDAVRAMMARTVAIRASTNQSAAAILDILDGLAANLDTVEQTTAVAMLADALARTSVDRGEFALIAATYALRARRDRPIELGLDPDGRYAAYDELRGRLAGLGGSLDSTPSWNMARRGRILARLAELARDARRELAGR